MLLGVITVPTPSGQNNFAFKYRINISDIFNTTKALTYTSIDNKGDKEKSEVYIIEHDSDLTDNQNWIQSRKWTSNYLYGSETLRTASRLDGYLFSNIGSHISNASLRLLGDATYNDKNSYLSIDSKAYYFSDSDFLTNSAVGYQKNLIESIFTLFSYSHILLFGLAVSCIIALFQHNHTHLLLYNILLLICFTYFYNIQKTSVKIISDREIWPHSNGIGGIGMEVNDKTGIIYISKYGQGQILCIGRNTFGKHSGEKVIVLEGGAKVNIDGETWVAPDYPLGENQGIKDALPVTREGEKIGSNSIVHVNDVCIIGTNSARINIDAIYK